MSIAHVQWALDHGPRHQTQALVLIALAERADASGSCWPGLAELAHRARVTERKARAALRELEAAGYIVTRLGGGRGRSSRYFLTMRKGDASDRVTPSGGYKYPDASVPLSGANPDASVPDETRTPASPYPVNPDARGTETRTLASPEPSGTIIGDVGGSACVPACVREGPKTDPHLEVLDAAGIDWQRDTSGKCFNSVERGYVTRWETSLGLPRDEILAVLRETTPARRGAPPSSLRYFDGDRGPMAKRAADLAALAKPLAPAATVTPFPTRRTLSVRDPAVHAATVEAAIAALRATEPDDPA